MFDKYDFFIIFLLCSYFASSIKWVREIYIPFGIDYTL